MAINLRDFKLQLAAASNHGSRESPVRIELQTGDVLDIGFVVWDTNSEAVHIQEWIPPVEPPPEPAPEG